MSKTPQLPPDDEKKRKADGTLHLPSGSDSLSEPPDLESSKSDPEPLTGSLHVDLSTPSDPMAKTMLGDSIDDDVADDGLGHAQISSSVAGIRSDLTMTINPQQLEGSELREFEAALKAALGKGDSSTGGASSATGESTIGGVESRLVLQSRQLVPYRSTDVPGADYRLRSVLGEGGMGTVFLAEQMSLERLVAVKVIKPLAPEDRTKLERSGRLTSQERQRREQFLSEAVVTGALDHPNIVPIHDVGRTGDNSPFYSMKQVEGTAWSKVIRNNTQSENLEILLKVSDAVAFAHSRGVVHRDIKPENVMLGDFGVVMLMDWGLAIVTPEFPRYGALKQTSSFGGSPAYMAPEMVAKRIERITAASDIYLLGGTLFEIITGMPPHPHPASDLTGWDAVKKYLEQVVSPNVIATVKPAQKGELLDIALRAMAKIPGDRYASVQEFQAAIRSYRSHAESVQLASKAKDVLKQADTTRDYGDFARAVFGYEEALNLWRGNQDAASGLLDAKLAYAERANEQEDYDLGLSLLDAEDARQKPLVSKLEKGRRERTSRQRRLRIGRYVTTALSVLLILGGVYSLKLIRDASDANQIALEAESKTKTAESRLAVVEDEANAKIASADAEAAQRINMATMEADRRTKDADVKVAEAEEKANDLKKQAEESAALALSAENAAKMARMDLQSADKAKEAAVQEAQEAIEAARTAEKVANDQKLVANDASRLAAFEEYAGLIAAARARIEQNEFEDARRILNKIREQREADKKPLEWEWKWLWRQTEQAESSAKLPAAGTDVVVVPGTERALVSLEGGQLENIVVGDGGRVKTTNEGGEAGTISALSQDGSLIATATVDADTGRPTGNIELTSTANGASAGVLSGHIPGDMIRKLHFLSDGRLLSASDDRTVRLWDVAKNREIAEAWHLAPVHDMAGVESPDGLIIAAAVADLRSGRVCVWTPNPQGGDRLKFLGEFTGHDGPVYSVAVTSDGQRFASGDSRGRVLLWNRRSLLQQSQLGAALAHAKVVMKDLTLKPSAYRTPPLQELHDPHSSAGLALTARSNNPAHDGRVTRVAFSRNGQRMLTTSADYTAKVWDLSNGNLLRTMRGHGGGVLSAQFLGAESQRVVTTGVDQTIRTWLTSGGDGTSVFQTPPSVSTLLAHDDAIWSASFDPSSNRIVTAGRDHAARILGFDPATATFQDLGELIDDAAIPNAENRPLIEGANYVAFSMAVRSDGRRLYVGDIEGFVRIWDMNKSVELATIADTGLNFGLALARDGKSLLTASTDKAAPARLWKLNDDGVPDGSPPVDLKPNDDAPGNTTTALAISPSGNMLFTGLARGEEGLGILWDAKSGRELARIAEHGKRINAAAFSMDSRSLFIGSDGALARYDIEKREVVETVPFGNAFVSEVDVADDGKKMLTVSWKNTNDGIQSMIQLWDIDGEMVGETLEESAYAKNAIPQPGDMLVSARFYPGSQKALTVARSQDRDLSQMKVWALSGVPEPKVETVLAFPKMQRTADSAVASQDPASGDLRWLTLHGDAVFEWNPRTRKHEKSFRQASGLTEAGFSLDGRFVATASRSVVIWDAQTRKPLMKIETPHEGPVFTVAWHPVQAMRFATGGKDGASGEKSLVKIWEYNPETQEASQVASFVNGATVRRVRWSADGRMLLAAGDNGEVRIWTADQPEAAPLVLRDDEGARRAFLCAEFSPDMSRVLAGGADGIARIWLLNDPEQKAGIPWARLSGHADEITDVGFLSNPAEEGSSMRYLTASRDKSARLWDVEDVHHLTQTEPVRVREVLALRKHDLGLTSVQATPDGRTLMTAGLDGRVILWPAGDVTP